MGYGPILGPLGLRIKLLFCTEILLYLKTLMDNDICDPALFQFNEEEWNAGIETGDSSFHAGPAKELCVNYEQCKIKEAL